MVDQTWTSGALADPRRISDRRFYVIRRLFRRSLGIRRRSLCSDGNPAARQSVRRVRRQRAGLSLYLAGELHHTRLRRDRPDRPPPDDLRVRGADRPADVGCLHRIPAHRPLEGKPGLTARKRHAGNQPLRAAVIFYSGENLADLKGQSLNSLFETLAQ